MKKNYIYINVFYSIKNNNIRRNIKSNFIYMRSFEIYFLLIRNLDLICLVFSLSLYLKENHSFEQWRLIARSRNERFSSFIAFTPLDVTFVSQTYALPNNYIYFFNFILFFRIYKHTIFVYLFV